MPLLDQGIWWEPTSVPCFSLGPLVLKCWDRNISDHKYMSISFHQLSWMKSPCFFSFFNPDTNESSYIHLQETSVNLRDLMLWQVDFQVVHLIPKLPLRSSLEMFLSPLVPLPPHSNLVWVSNSILATHPAECMHVNFNICTSMGYINILGSSVLACCGGMSSVFFWDVGDGGWHSG